MALANRLPDEHRLGLVTFGSHAEQQAAPTIDRVCHPRSHALIARMHAFSVRPHGSESGSPCQPSRSGVAASQAQYARTLRAYSRRLRSANGRPASQRSKRSGTSPTSMPSLIRRATLFVAAAETRSRPAPDPVCRHNSRDRWRLRAVSRHGAGETRGCLSVSVDARLGHGSSSLRNLSRIAIAWITSWLPSTVVSTTTSSRLPARSGRMTSHRSGSSPGVLDRATLSSSSSLPRPPSSPSACSSRGTR